MGVGGGHTLPPRKTFGSSVCWLFLSIVFDLERTNQLSLLPDKDLVYSCHPIEPYQVTKNQTFSADPILCFFVKSNFQHRNYF
ncbi:MAG: hypothetical protein EWV81_02365 [Microcystis aeruginosa Ma_SC_T_19800800_S464]|uniref:Uncharacterized protein n=1 Tax=Microcystis aeruginosa Ma_SC_T_19800800_S464 TaxID=2486257 RepID=A0A552E4W4_MICAE|nr:MAG: hypothetical protein EWV81_02365 [Microcystis aeruginosa Ma_SC_T_19800800_S464]